MTWCKKLTAITLSSFGGLIAINYYKDLQRNKKRSDRTAERNLLRAQLTSWCVCTGMLLNVQQFGIVYNVHGLTCSVTLQGLTIFIESGLQSPNNLGVNQSEKSFLCCIISHCSFISKWIYGNSQTLKLSKCISNKDMAIFY